MKVTAGSCGVSFSGPILMSEKIEFRFFTLLPANDRSFPKSDVSLLGCRFPGSHPCAHHRPSPAAATATIAAVGGGWYYDTTTMSDGQKECNVWHTKRGMGCAKGSKMEKSTQATELNSFFFLVLFMLSLLVSYLDQYFFSSYANEKTSNMFCLFSLSLSLLTACVTKKPLF